MERKGVIVYYSYAGNTEVAAKELQRLTGFGLVKLEEKRKRKPGSMMGPAFSALLGLGSSLLPTDFSMKGYDDVFLGVQVWAGKTTPAINTYLKKANLEGKQIWLFVTKGDPKEFPKFLDSVKSRIEKKGGQLKDVLWITSKWDPKTNTPIKVDLVKAPVEAWIENYNGGNR